MKDELCFKAFLSKSLGSTVAASIVTSSVVEVVSLVAGVVSVAVVSTIGTASVSTGVSALAIVEMTGDVSTSGNVGVEGSAGEILLGWEN